MVILLKFSFFLDKALKLCIFVLVEEPFENSFLNLLIVFILEEFVREEFN